MDQASLRRKSIWRTQAWCGGHYPCLQDVDKSNENNKNGAHDGHKSIGNTSDDDSSNINNERRCFSVFLSWTTPRNIAKPLKTQENYRQTIRYLKNSAIYPLVLSLFFARWSRRFCGSLLTLWSLDRLHFVTLKTLVTFIPASSWLKKYFLTN